MTATYDLEVGDHPTPISPAARWLTVKDIAADLAVSTSTVYKWSARGRPWFPRSIRLRSGDLRVRRDWYDEWLTQLETDQ